MALGDVLGAEVRDDGRVRLVVDLGVDRAAQVTVSRTALAALGDETLGQALVERERRQRRRLRGDGA